MRLLPVGPDHAGCCVTREHSPSDRYRRSRRRWTATCVVAGRIHAHPARHSPRGAGDRTVTTRNDLVTTLRLSRRSFLVRSGAVSVGVAFGAVAVGRKPQAPLKAPVGAGKTARLAPNPWVTLSTDGTIEITTPGIEMGQGTLSTLPRYVAEELDADWNGRFESPGRPSTKRPTAIHSSLAYRSRPARAPVSVTSSCCGLRVHRRATCCSRQPPGSGRYRLTSSRRARAS